MTKVKAPFGKSAAHAAADDTHPAPAGKSFPRSLGAVALSPPGGDNLPPSPTSTDRLRQGHARQEAHRDHQGHRQEGECTCSCAEVSPLTCPQKDGSKA